MHGPVKSVESTRGIVLHVSHLQIRLAAGVLHGRPIAHPGIHHAVDVEVGFMRRVMPHHRGIRPLPLRECCRAPIRVIQAVLHPPIELIICQRSKAPAPVTHSRNDVAFIDDPFHRGCVLVQPNANRHVVLVQ